MHHLSLGRPATPDTSHCGHFAGDVVLGKYVLLAPLAKGGMGAVWRGRNELLGTDVAIKLIINGGSMAGAPPSDTRSMLRRAHAEARMAAQLRHPAVCQALDFGVTDQGAPVIVSELLHGEPLAELLLAQGKLESKRAIELLLPIVDALGAAHARGIVHRDVKPSNIFLARDFNGGLQPKLLDFGIARTICDSTRITAAGTVCGTPDYMSPEQARGNSDVDGRSDLWSICATLFELVSGNAPFPGENYNAVMFSVINEPPIPLSGLGPEDAELVRVLARGLNKRREERFQTAPELAAALSDLLPANRTALRALGLTHTLESARPPTGVFTASRATSAPKRPSPLGGLLAVLLMGLTGFGTGLLYRRSAPASTPTVRAETENQVGRSLTPQPVAAGAPVAAVSTPANAATLPATTSRPRPPDRATVGKRQPVDTTVSPPAPSARQGASDAAMASAPQPPQRENETPPSSRPPQPNALGYDFGL